LLDGKYGIWYNDRKEGALMMKVLVMSAANVSALYILAALLPALVLLNYVYRQDRVEKEPAGLLFSLLWQGVKAALAAIVLELIAESILNRFFLPGSFLHTVLLAFLVVAAVEEGTKYYFLKRRTWKDPNFNYRFDAIVYAVFVSLGFATVENLLYVLSSEGAISVAIARAILAVPLHVFCGVFMGYYYGIAKQGEINNRKDLVKKNLFLSIEEMMPKLKKKGIGLIVTAACLVVVYFIVMVAYMGMLMQGM
jgi:RsiW-degrading membrane proteinase PrsW (M82 family)